MVTKAYFIDVGQGNMVVVVFPDNYTLVYDCNITSTNMDDVFSYMASFMPKPTIDVFINSHRETDHMNGIRDLHNQYPINLIVDSGVSANTDSARYQSYMNLKREIRSVEAKSFDFLKAKPEVSFLNGLRPGQNDPNSQSIVVQIDHLGSKLLLAGDTDSLTWAQHIVPEHGERLKSLVLYASHHGSKTFFNPDSDKWKDYTDSMQNISPAITIISVGENNQHGHPHPEAVKYYKEYSHGALDGQRIFRTDTHGSMQLDLKGDGKGTIMWSKN